MQTLTRVPVQRVTPTTIHRRSLALLLGMLLGASVSLPALSDPAILAGLFPVAQKVSVRSAAPAAKAPTATQTQTMAMTLMSFTSGTLAVGALAGEAGVSGGAASYSIPIVVPPGRARMQPSVSVSYSSRAGNGLLGMGWSLNVGSSISRCPQMLGISGEVILGVRLLDTDRLCLDGERLILVSVSGTYGANGAVYRTESESFVRVEQLGAAFSSNSSKFLVRYADGRVAYYGHDAQSVFGSATTPLTWLLTRVEDTATNSIIYTYDRSVVGETPIASISYTGRGTTAGNRTVGFVYETRSDMSGSPVAGVMQTQSRRLQKITTSVAGLQHREYRFSYKDQSASTGRALLLSVEECATLGTLYCLPPTTFEWQEPAVNLSSALRVSPPGDTAPLIPMVIHYNTDPGNVPYPYAIEPGASFLGKGKKELWYQSGGGVKMLHIDETWLTSQGATGITDAGGGPWPEIGMSFWEYMPDTRDRYYDFNNDGRVDLFGGASVSFTNADGTWNTQPTTIAGGAAFAGKDSKVADFTGDGYADIVVVDGSPDRKIYMYRNTGAAGGLSFEARTEIADPSEVATDFYCGTPLVLCATSMDGAQLHAVTDVDGDLRPDIRYSAYDNADEPLPPVNLVLNHYGENPAFQLTGASGGAPVSGSPNFIYLYGDFNGDGIQEIAVSDAGSAASNPDFNPQWSISGSGGVSGTASNLGGAIARYAMRVGDIDNDGRDELLVPDARVATMCMGDLHWTNTDDPDYPLGAEMYGELCGGKLIKNIPSLAENDATIFSYAAYRAVQSASGTISFADTGIRFNAPGTGFTVGDANGDGLNDIVWAVNRNQQMYYSDDCGLNPSQCSYTFPYYGNYMSLATQAAPDLMVTATDGFGRTAEWTYDPLSSTDPALSLSDDDDGDSAPEPFYELNDADGFEDADHFYFTSTMYVVSRFSTTHHGVCDSGAPGCDTGSNTRRYAYRDALYNNKGRGFRGFGSMLEEGVERGIQTKTSFLQKFPFGGQAITSATSVKGNGGALIQQADSTYAAQWLDANLDPVTAGSANAKTVLVRTELLTAYSYDPVAVMLVSTRKVDPTYTGACTTQSLETLEDPVFGASGTNLRRSVSVTTAYNTKDAGAGWLICQANTRTTATTQSARARYTQGASTDTKTLVETFTYNSRRQPLVTTVEPQGSAGVLKRITTYGYNDSSGTASFGNLTSLTVGGGSGATAVTNRVTQTTYSTDGYFPYQVTDPVGLVTTTLSSTFTGAPTNVTGPDGYTTVIQYDAFGRQAVIVAVDGARYFTYAAASAPDGARYSVTTTWTGRPTTITTYDALNRVLRTATQGFTGADVQVDAVYDAYGRLRRTTEPYFAPFTGSEFATAYQYDLMDRETSRVDAKGLTTSTMYTGTIALVTATDGSVTQTAEQEKDTLGLLLTAKDHYGNRTHFRYDAMGNPMRIVDAIGAVVTTVFNDIGQKTALNDPDLGQWLYTYNVLGELLTQRDARLKTTTFTYDLAGRMVTRLELETGGNCTTTWGYGAPGSGTGAGKLASVSVAGSGCPSAGYAEAYRYDLLGRSSSVVSTLGTGGAISEFATTYDSAGRVDALWYPTMANASLTVPNAPLNVVADPSYSTGGPITISWTAPIGGPTPTSYKVYKRKLPTSSWGTAQTLAANVFSYIYNIALTGSYEFLVQACAGAICTDGEIAWADVDSSGGQRSTGGGEASSLMAPLTINGRFGVKQVYNANGYLASVSLASDPSQVFWTANSLSAYGAVAGETSGNGLTTNRGFKTGTPFVEAVTTGSGSVQNLGYAWNAFGQLTSRTDSVQSLTETFGYDLLNRVISGTLSVGSTTTFAASYDATGNISSKTDTAGTRSYSYPAPVEGTYNHPHGVTSSGGSSYSYDANGNMTSRAGGTVLFNIANLPTSITGSGYTSTFNYGPARNRYKQVAGYSGRTETTLYVGSLYERMTKTGSTTTEYRYQVTAGGLPVARVTQYSTGTVRTQFMHRDHLGSIDTITDESGAVVTKMSFDAHGTRRAANASQGTAWNTLLAYSTSVALFDGFRDKTTRGFTDHEMLDNVGLIHMNGRVYDPKLGRFLSVDPVFQFPTNTQSLNPYTYVLNTPLSMTDPTGLEGLGSCSGEDFNVCGVGGGSQDNFGKRSPYIIGGQSGVGGSTSVVPASGALGVAGGISISPGSGGSIAINGSTVFDFGNGTIHGIKRDASDINAPATLEQQDETAAPFVQPANEQSAGGTADPKEVQAMLDGDRTKFRKRLAAAANDTERAELLSRFDAHKFAVQPGYSPETQGAVAGTAAALTEGKVTSVFTKLRTGHGGYSSMSEADRLLVIGHEFGHTLPKIVEQSLKDGAGMGATERFKLRQVIAIGMGTTQPRQDQIPSERMANQFAQDVLNGKVDNVLR